MRTAQRGTQREKGASNAAIVLLLLLVMVAGATYYAHARGWSLREAFTSLKESSQDAATTSKVRTAMLLSKHVSAFDIKVETRQGGVTLTGQVPSGEVKTMAAAITQNTSGVRQVHNELAINPSAERNSEMQGLAERVADLEMKTILSDDLSKSPELKDQHIEVQVKKRMVTLDGTVETSAQKHAAAGMAWQVSGVQGVTDHLAVTNAQATPESADEKLARRVEFELYSTKAVSLKTVRIHSQNGEITLTGSVASRAEKLLAEKVAQAAEGVRKVTNNLAAPEEIGQ